MRIVSFKQPSPNPFLERREHRACGALFLSLLILLLVACSGAQPAATPAGAASNEATTTPTVAPAVTLPPPGGGAAYEEASGEVELEEAPTATPEPFTPPDLAYLAGAFNNVLEAFDGLGSYYVVDLQSGAAIAHHGDLAISGTSIVKIPILVETYRALDSEPTLAQTRLITETATLSGNYTANLLLELVAGQPDPFAGAQQVTHTMRRLGLHNSFIAVPYDLEARSDYMSTYLTPANRVTDPSTNPDPSMQTTVRDMGVMLQMIYACSQGGGMLLQTYPEQLTAAECKEILAVMQENDIDAFIEEGVPAGVPVAHKHGWVGDTHGDAGIVFAGDHAYVMAIALYRPGWLEWADSTVVIAELSQLAYEHFTNPNAYSAETLQTPVETLPVQASLPTATPALPVALIEGTGGAGLTMRETPGGAELSVLPEASVVYLTDAQAASANGYSWREVVGPTGATGWVVADFLNMQ
jgi:beta-lactamase class A